MIKLKSLKIHLPLALLILFVLPSFGCASIDLERAHESIKGDGVPYIPGI